MFKDVDTIALGVDFADAITQAVSTRQVLLVVIAYAGSRPLRAFPSLS